MPEPLFRRLALLGIGLIGSSVARIARERGTLAAEVVANART
jgi:cyclohexadieny/prephenate dehydrogenase